METLQALKARKSERNFSSRQISEADLAAVLDAANYAPVGFGEVENIHLTVVQDEEILERMKESGKFVYQDPINDIYYGAPTVIVISTREGLISEIQPNNAAVMSVYIMLAATALGIDNCYVWGTVRSFRSEPELGELLEIPDGFTVMGSVSLGYGAETNDEPNQPKNFPTNRV